MKKSHLAALLVAVAWVLAGLAFAQFSDVRQMFNIRGRTTGPVYEFIRTIPNGRTTLPDSLTTPTVDLGDGGVRSVEFFFHANRASSTASVCSLAVALVSTNDTNYVDASSINGVTVIDNLTGQCVTDSCHADRSIKLIANGNARLTMFRFAKAATFWKVNAVDDDGGGPHVATATSQIDSMRIYIRTQHD